MKRYDVVVIGGGISGAVAAISAARLGVSVLLVEQYGFLGGMLTAAGVGPMMTFHAGNKQVVKGITGELIERMSAKGKSPGHIFDTTGYTYTVTPFDAEAMKRELEEMLISAGGEILYHAVLLEVLVENKVAKKVVLLCRSQKIEISGEVFIDATGDGDLAYMAGVNYIKGRPTDGACQPMTMNMKMTHVDINRVKQYIKTNKEEFPRIKEDLNIVERGPRLSIGGFVKSFEQGNKTGELSFKRGEILFFETNNEGEVIINTSRVIMPDPTDPFAYSKAEIEGRKQTEEIEKFLIRHIKGFEKAVLIHTGPCCIGVRSSRQIEGLYTLTEDDLANQEKFHDVIAHGGYHIDVHPPVGNYDKEFLEEFKKRSHMSWGKTYNIPYRSLINNRVQNIITVGRCISTTFMAQGAIRVSPIAGAIGHAGGASAAISVQSKTRPQKISIPQLQETLISQNAHLEQITIKDKQN